MFTSLKCSDIALPAWSHGVSSVCGALSRSLRNRHCIAACGLAVLVAALAAPCNAQTLALDFTGGSAGTTFVPATYGWSFTLSSPMQVTQLGLFDADNNGFINSHQVGLWTNDGALLSSTVIPAGTGATAVVSGSGFGSFRFVDITPLVLAPGTYVVGAGYLIAPDAPDFLRIQADAVATAFGLTFVNTRFVLNSGFAFPANATVPTERGIFGPNLRFAAPAQTAAPEPGALTLLALTSLPIGGVILRRRRARTRRVI